MNVRTSIVLEAGIWDAIGEILDRENLDLNSFCQMVNKRRRGYNFTSAIRVVVVICFRSWAINRRLSELARSANNQFNAPDAEQPPTPLLPDVLKSFHKGLSHI